MEGRGGSRALVLQSIKVCNVAQVLDKAKHLAAIHKAPDADWAVGVVLGPWWGMMRQNLAQKPWGGGPWWRGEISAPPLVLQCNT